MDRWKSTARKRQPGRDSDVEKVRREQIRQGEDAGARKGREVATPRVYFAGFVLRRVEK